MNDINRKWCFEDDGKRRQTRAVVEGEEIQYHTVSRPSIVGSHGDCFCLLVPRCDCHDSGMSEIERFCPSLRAVRFHGPREERNRIKEVGARAGEGGGVACRCTVDSSEVVAVEEERRYFT